MAHRGRHVIQIGLLDYPAKDIFRKIQGLSDMPVEYTAGQCDVVQHLGLSNTKRFPGAGCKDQDITISVINNPSHLECANPVSQGKTKAKQDDANSVDTILNVQLHGDSAFVGQGIVYEGLILQNLPKYSIGGSIHIIQNNQIGYTTNIQDSRSTKYCSDHAKCFGYPVIHVNGDDVETVHKISKFVVAYRQQFKKDIFIDLITYRRYGHNEVDEPSFTQPIMYNKIRNSQISLPKAYNQILQQENLAKAEDYDKIRERVFKHLDQDYEQVNANVQTLEKVTNPESKGSKAFTHKWRNMRFSQFAQEEHYLQNTGLDKKYLQDLARYYRNDQFYFLIRQSVTLGPNFNIHPRIQKFFIEDRLEQINDNHIDWATAESIAVSSLLEQGYNVRLSGQDVERGTFSQRHWVLVDQKTEEQFSPLLEFSSAKNQGRLQVCNSPLSEASVMAFDYGYSMENPNNLVIWEAQFGDFYNTAQFIADTFITNSEEKWMRQSSLALFLPHGFDGAGPEHSSSRIERWLQMGVQSPVNFQFINPTTPENIFHALRRQMLRSYRKPLVVANAKTLLRLKQARSTFESLDKGTSFQPVYCFSPSLAEAQTIFFCSGRIQYTVRELIQKQGYKNHAIIVLEELLPFPQKQISDLLKQIKGNAKMIWLQDEPQNAGAYHYATRFIKGILNEQQKSCSIHYIGRAAIPTVATGVSKQHYKEQAEIEEQIVQALQ